MAYHRTHGVDTRIARIFNTYGPRMRLNDGRVVPNFVGQALRGKPLTVYGDGSQTRSFCYVSDLIEGICRLLLAEVSEPVNLGNPQEMTILELAHKIVELTGSSSRIVFVQPEDVRVKDDPKLRKPDIARARRLLGWEPAVSVEEGLRQTIEWFHSRV
jgi:dTDP-glucose 4,6-dehydratase